VDENEALYIYTAVQFINIYEKGTNSRNTDVIEFLSKNVMIAGIQELAIPTSGEQNGRWYQQNKFNADYF